MGTVSVSLPSDGSTADVADYNTPITTIVNAINGGLDNTNITAGAAIATSKLADDAGISTAKIAADAVTDAKLVYGKVRSRQGGSATNWSTTGVTTYDYSATNTFTQVGAKSVAGTTGTDQAITFPTAFNQVPIVVVTPITATGANVTFSVNTITATGFNLRIVFSGGGSQTETASWIAIGE